MVSYEEKMAEVKAQLNNTNTLDEEMAADQWEAGDVCGEKGCERCVRAIHHPRNPESTVPPHPSYNEYEFVCNLHGIVATR